MDTIQRVVKVVSAAPESKPNIPELFSKCGRILAMHPVKADHKTYFIEFEHAHSVDNALKLIMRDVSVVSLASVPHLMEEYTIVSSMRGSRKEKNTSAYNDKTARQEPRPLDGPRQKKKKHGSRDFGNRSGSHDHAHERPPHSSTQLVPRSVPGHSSRDSLCSSGHVVPPIHLSEIAERQQPRSISSFDIAPRDTLSLPISGSTTQEPSLPMPPALPSPPSAGSTTPESRLNMVLCDEVISYDLSTLEPDPSAIIQLLKASASERGDWVQVACHYRRMRNPSAAISVVASLLKAMRAHGSVEDELKPAYLLLSACEGDLARRSTDVEAAARHRASSQRWLQKVYGSVSSESAAAMTPARPTSSGVPDTTRSHGAMTLPASPTTCEPPASAPHFSTLERDIQSLHDFYAAQSSKLSESRVAKRQLEDALTEERHHRRKLEDRIDVLERELDRARGMEASAVQQVKGEVAARRKVEGSLEQERARRKDLEKRLEARAAKPLFEDLANLFQSAAKGEQAVALSTYCGLAGNH